MREIKFRAWDVFYKKLAYQDPDEQGIEVFWRMVRHGKQAGREVPVMQFTGITDKNGRDIYEGDVLLYNDTESEYVDVGIGGQGVKVAEQEVNSITSVECREGEFGFTTNSPYGETLQDKTWYPLALAVREELEWVEVIGNIYDNPELLNEDRGPKP